jgi:1-acyl-sn-glycerol-3-phosphate acyltransferase
MSAIHNPLTASLRLAAWCLWTLLFMLPYALLLAASGRTACRRAARWYWRGTAILLGFNVVVHGQPSAIRPSLFVANHVSYFDIVVLGSLLRAAFVAKREVAGWPGFGLIAKLGRTVFVDRRPRKSREQRDAMRARLGGERESLILFPEGTSSNGNRVLPFKSALFSVAEQVLHDGRSLTVQPISLAYTRLDGLPLGRNWRPLFAWYGDMALAPHVWTAVGLGRLTVEVVFHPPVRLDQFPSRKALADYCQDVVRRGVETANAGRVPATAA